VTIFMFKAGMVWAKVSSTMDLEEVSIRCGGPCGVCPGYTVADTHPYTTRQQ